MPPSPLPPFGVGDDDDDDNADDDGRHAGRQFLCEIFRGVSRFDSGVGNFALKRGIQSFRQLHSVAALLMKGSK